jgi:hypothetical protein
MSLRPSETQKGGVPDAEDNRRRHFHDGVMQASGGPTEDPTQGFKFGGWVMPCFDEVGGEELDLLFKNRDLLLGRKTYEILAAYRDVYLPAPR